MRRAHSNQLRRAASLSSLRTKYALRAASRLRNSMTSLMSVALSIAVATCCHEKFGGSAACGRFGRTISVVGIGVRPFLVDCGLVEDVVDAFRTNPENRPWSDSVGDSTWDEAVGEVGGRPRTSTGPGAEGGVAGVDDLVVKSHVIVHQKPHHHLSPGYSFGYSMPGLLDRLGLQ